MRTLTRIASVGVLALLAIAGSSTPAAAQGVGVGFKIGPTFADFTSDVLDFDKRTGWHAGLFVGGNRDGVAGWQTEFNWLRRRGNVSPGGNDFSIDYLQIPIFLRLNAGTNSKNGFAIYGIGGPAFAFKIADEINGVTIDDAFEGTEIGLVLGAGLEITRLILEGRYEWGFRKINKNFSTTEEIKTRSFTVMAGIRFN